MPRPCTGPLLRLVCAAALLVAYPVGTVAADEAASVEPAATDDPAGESIRWIAGADRIGTAIAASQAGWTSAASAVVATAHAFPDALVGAPVAASVDGPLLLTQPGHLPTPVGAELERLGVDEVLLLGGTGAVSAAVERQIAELRGAPRVIRIAGTDRYETAVRAALHSGAGGRPVIVASGTTFADAVSGAALSAGSGEMGVLLATEDAVPEGTRRGIEDLAARGGVLVGGRAALGEGVAEQLASQLGDLDRLAGNDRYATSVAVAEFALATTEANPRPLVVAAGSDYPDALAAGALASRLDGVVLLAPRFRLTDATDVFIRAYRDRWSQAIVVGGAGAVDEDVLAEVSAALTGAHRPPQALHAVGTPAGFRGTARPLPQRVADEMTGVSWHPGCPVGLDDLVLLELTHRDDTGQRRHGELVVAAHVASDVLHAFARIHDAGVPIGRMRRIDAYDGDDDASMADDNTSGFNCRPVTGGSSWSQHAYGTAVDINPIRNPYVRGSTVLPAAGQAYVDRSDLRPGMAVRPGAIVTAFVEIGWGWGGDWRSVKDYMHFSENGR
jgi:putative cell wall-binding protein